MSLHITKYKTENGKTRKVAGKAANSAVKKAEQHQEQGGNETDRTKPPAKQGA